LHMEGLVIQKMKVVILCGGMGQRMREYTDAVPKPLVSICGKPMLWHIMKIYSSYGFNDFVLLLGYKGEKIKQYFLNYKLNTNNFTLETDSGKIEMWDSANDRFKITFLDTGLKSMTGCRIKKAQQVIGHKPFMLTYGDGLSDININKLIEFHSKKERIATVTGINKKSQYGILKAHEGIATSFGEKQDYIGTINGGFFVLQPEVFNYLNEDEGCVFEDEPIKKLVQDGELAVYIHDGFWASADTQSDVLELNKRCKDIENLRKAR